MQQCFVCKHNFYIFALCAHILMRLGIVKASFASALDFSVYLHLNILRTLITIMKSEMKRRYVAGVLAMLLPIFTMYAQKDTTITTGTWKYTGEYPAGKGDRKSTRLNSSH